MSLAMLETDLLPQLARAAQNVPRDSQELPGEDRIVVSGVSWEQYVAFEKGRGAENSHPRLYYLDEQLEIMTTSRRHERLSECLGEMLADYLLTTDREAIPCGQATLQKVNQGGAEPDKSWCIGEEKEYPDIALEIALTSGGLDKLEIYRQFPVREVWFWRKDGLEIWNLNDGASGYEGPARASRLLPGLDLALIERCLALPTWKEARRAFRQALKPE